MGRGRADPPTAFDGKRRPIDRQPYLHSGFCRRQRLELRYRARQRGRIQLDHELEQRPMRTTPMYQNNFPSQQRPPDSARRPCRGPEFRYQRDGRPHRTIPVPLRQFLQRPNLATSTESCSLTGTMTFDGAGKYTLSNTQMFDSMGVANTRFLHHPRRRNLRSAIQRHRPTGQSSLLRPLFSAPSASPWSSPVQRKMMASIFLSRCKHRRLPPPTVCLSGTFTVGTLDFLNARLHHWPGKATSP